MSTFPAYTIERGKDTWEARRAVSCLHKTNNPFIPEFSGTFVVGKGKTERCALDDMNKKG